MSDSRGEGTGRMERAVIGFAFGVVITSIAAGGLLGMAVYVAITDDALFTQCEDQD